MGVITKPDLVDRGAEDKVITNFTDVLLPGSIGSGNWSLVRSTTPLWLGLYEGMQQKSKQLMGKAR